MTREEAIAILIREKDEDPFMRTEYREQIHEAFKMAIEALKQEPCEDAISRETARRIVDSGRTRQQMIDMILATPPIKPQEPKTGHWIGDKAYPICPECNCNIVEEYISCSDYAEMYKPMKYCPNCGAKMESEE